MLLDVAEAALFVDERLRSVQLVPLDGSDYLHGAGEVFALHTAAALDVVPFVLTAWVGEDFADFGLRRGFIAHEAGGGGNLGLGDFGEGAESVFASFGCSSALAVSCGGVSEGPHGSHYTHSIGHVNRKMSDSRKLSESAMVTA